MLSQQTQFLMLAENSGNDREPFREADHVAEQPRIVLSTLWSFGLLFVSSSNRSFQLRRMKCFPVPLTSAAFPGVVRFRISLQ